MKKTILLPTKRFEGSPSEGTQIRVNFESEQNVIKNDERDVILNLSQQFYEEKNRCNNYKIFGKIKMIFRNISRSVSGNTYSPLMKKLYLNNVDGDYTGYMPYDEFAFIRKDVRYQANPKMSVTGLTNFTGFTNSLRLSGNTDHQTITPLMSTKHNWNLYLSYAYTGITNFPMKYTLSGNTTPLSFVSGDGIPFRVLTGDTYHTFTSPVKHGMEMGEYIIISGTPYYINSVGNEIFNSELYVINILSSQIKTSITDPLVTGKRCKDLHNSGSTTSEYYVHKHKILTGINDYRIDNIGFESPIFEEEKKIINRTSGGDTNVVIERNRMESIIYDFIEPLVLTGLTNNRGFTPNEIYLTTIFRNGAGYFNYPPKVGYSFHFHDSWVDKHFSGTTSNETGMTKNPFYGYNNTLFYSGNTLAKGNELYGDFIEYIPDEMRERVISESFHKITVRSNIFDHNQENGDDYFGSEPNNPNGLYYQTHYPIKLRELSPYVETSTTSNVNNLPDNVKFFPNDKMWKWRDVYDLGYIDDKGNGVDFAYMNDMLYVHKDINFYLRNETVFTNKKDGVKKFKFIPSMSLINC